MRFLLALDCHKRGTQGPTSLTCPGGRGFPSFSDISKHVLDYFQELPQTVCSAFFNKQTCRRENKAKQNKTLKVTKQPQKCRSNDRVQKLLEKEKVGVAKRWQLKATSYSTTTHVCKERGISCDIF